MAARKEPETAGTEVADDPFADMTTADPKDVKVRSNAGRPLSPMGVKFRAALEESLVDRQVRSIPCVTDKKDEYASQLKRASSVAGKDEIKSGYRHDPIANRFHFAPAEVWAEAKAGK